MERQLVRLRLGQLVQVVYQRRQVVSLVGEAAISCISKG